jgi:hypothetical protein
MFNRNSLIFGVLQMSNITDEIRKLESRIADMRSKLLIEEKVLSRLKAIQSPNRATIENGGVKTFRRNSVASHIEAVFKEANKPMSISEITTALEQRGVTTDSKTGLQPMVASVLSKNTNTFIKSEGRRGIYALKVKQTENNENNTV